MTMDFNYFLLIAMMYWPISLGILCLVFSPAYCYMEAQLVKRFSFSMVNHWSRISFVVVLMAPGVLYLAYTTRCRSIDHLPLGWMALGLLAMVAAALIYRNRCFTPWRWALASALMETAALALVLVAGSVLPMTLTALGGMDTGGRRWPCPNPVGVVSTPIRFV